MKKGFTLNLIVLSVLFLTVAAYAQQNKKGAKVQEVKKTQVDDTKDNNAAENNTSAGQDMISAIKVKDIDGKEVSLSDYKGKVLLIVNVASKCGNTPQYEALEEIYEKYRAQGFEILAFPSNDFGGQEPGSNEEIKEFCTTNYGVTFRLFDKVKVLGPEKSPLYKALTSNEATGRGEVKWNFEKFLISKDGKIIERFGPKVQPDSPEVISAIEGELKSEKKS